MQVGLHELLGPFSFFSSNSCHPKRANHGKNLFPRPLTEMLPHHDNPGHGSGKLLCQAEDGGFNFDKAATIDPSTGQPVEGFYKVRPVRVPLLSSVLMCLLLRSTRWDGRLCRVCIVPVRTVLSLLRCFSPGWMSSVCHCVVCAVLSTIAHTNVMWRHCVAFIRPTTALHHTNTVARRDVGLPLPGLRLVVRGVPRGVRGHLPVHEPPGDHHAFPSPVAFSCFSVATKFRGRPMGSCPWCVKDKPTTTTTTTRRSSPSLGTRVRLLVGLCLFWVEWRERGE